MGCITTLSPRYTSWKNGLRQPLAGSENWEIENWEIENWELISTNRLDEGGIDRRADRHKHGVACKDENEAHQDVALFDAL